MAVPGDVNALQRDRSIVQRLNSQVAQDTKTAWRFRTIINYNPYMANNVNAVAQMAQMNISDRELFNNTGALFGMQSADSMMKMMAKYDPSVQRSIFTGLTTAQQQTLRQMGYELPTSDIDDANIFEQAIGLVGKGLGAVTSGIGGKVIGPIVSPALNLMDSAADFVVGRPFRTISQLGTDGQVAAFVSGLAAAAGVLAAGVTGGASLALVGGAFAAGGVAGSLAEQTITGNGDEWLNAWSRAGNGEKLFSNDGIKKATEILGDPRLVNMAKKVAEQLGPGISLIDIAQDIAGVEQSLNPDVQQKQVKEIAKELAAEGTPEYEKVYKGISELLLDPLFTSAVKELEQSKISFGRSIANLINLDPDSSAYRFVSGSLDAASLIVLDPFLIAGKLNRIASFSKRGIDAADGISAAARFREVAQRPEMRNAYQVVAEAVNAGDATNVRKLVPELLPVWHEMVNHRKSLNAVEGFVDLGARTLEADDVVDFIVGPLQLSTVMKGAGVVQGVSYGQLRGLNSFQYATRSARGAIGDFMRGVADVKLEKILPKLAQNKAALQQMMETLPSAWRTQVRELFGDELGPQNIDEVLTKLGDTSLKSTSGAYQAGRGLAKIPGLKTFASMYDLARTYVPRGGVINLDPASIDSIEDINNFVDLFRAVGVPSYVREIWKKTIYESPNVGARANAIASMVDSLATSTGIRGTQKGSELLDEVLDRTRQAYALGPVGKMKTGLAGVEEVPIGALPDRDMAVMMQIPDLQAMRQAVKQGTLLRMLVGVGDSVAVEAFQNRFWKPAVLLRFGFVVRNATEDILAFVSRAGAGHLAQNFAARSIAQENVFRDAVFELDPRNGRRFRKAPEKMTVIEQYAVKKRWDVPAHLRPLARVIERYGPEGIPALRVASDYGYWLRNKLRTGFLAEDNKLRTFYERLGNKYGDVPAPKSGISWSSDTNVIKANIRANLDAILFGGEYSTRRLLIGGVNSQRLEAAKEFQSMFMGSIMQRIGSNSLLPWSNEIANEQILDRLVESADGQPKIVRVAMRGERTLVRAGDTNPFVDDIYTSVLNRVESLTDSDIASRALLDVDRVYDESIQQLLPEQELAEILHSYRKISETLFDVAGKGDDIEDDIVHLFLILAEPLSKGHLKADRFRAAVKSILRDPNANRHVTAMAQRLDNLYGGNAFPSPDELKALFLQDLPVDKTGRLDSTLSRNVGVIDSLISLTGRIGELPATAQKWILSSIGLDIALQGEHLRLYQYGSSSGRKSFLKNVLARNEEEIGPFYQSLDIGLRNARQNLVNELNEGKWNDSLKLNREFIDSPKGTEFSVIRFPTVQPVSRANEFGQMAEVSTDEILESMKLLRKMPLPEGGFVYVPNLETIATAIGSRADLSMLARGQTPPGLADFGDNLIDAIQKGNPLLIADKEMAEKLHRFLSTNFQKAGMKLSDVKSSWLPVSDPADFARTYPNLGANSVTYGDNESSLVINWARNSDGELIYPELDEYVARAKTDYNDSIAERLIRTIEQSVRSGLRSQIVTRPSATLYMRDVDGTAMRVEPGTVVMGDEKFYLDEELKQTVRTGETKYFDVSEVRFEGNEQVMWDIVSPVLYDHSENLGARVVYATKDNQPIMVTKMIKQQGDYWDTTSSRVIDAADSAEEVINVPLDVVRLRTATVEDVRNTPASMLPDVALARVYEPVLTNAWDKFVNFGFNKVFGPILDAVARSPIAFNAFANAYERNLSWSNWMYDTQENREMLGNAFVAFKEKGVTFASNKSLTRFEQLGRIAADAHDLPEAAMWGSYEAIAYLRGLNAKEFASLGSQIENAVRSGRLTKEQTAGYKNLIKYVENNSAELRNVVLRNDDPWTFIDFIDNAFGEGITMKKTSPFSRFRDKPERYLQKVSQTSGISIDAIRALARLEPDEWNQIQRVANSRRIAKENASQYAAEFAIKDTMPFIDTHEVRSQFAEWGRGYLPFWYAEENFLKRWARIFSIDGPIGGLATARKLQLTAQGMRTMGIVRTDPQGNSYFVYPGSELLFEALNKIPGLNMLPAQAFLQTSTDRIIPGFTPTFGAPSFSPLIGLPLEVSTWIFPESPAVRQLQKGVMGDMSVGQDIVQMIFPAQIVNTIKAVYEFSKPFDSTGTERINSAMMAAAAHLEATDNGVPDDATPADIDEYLRRLRNHARIIVLGQALAGWFTPGPAQALQTTEGNSLSWLTEGQIDNPAEFLSSTYFELIQNMGIEEGTAMFLERFPNGTVKDVVNPSAYTVSRTSSVSGAPLPSTEEGIAFYETNKQVFDQYKFAGPWLLPQDGANIDNKVQYAYDAQLIDGLRERKTPEEFVRELKFREASAIYFQNRQDYLNEYATLKELGRKSAMKRLRAEWDNWSAGWKATHPVFAEELTNSDARQRRQNVMDEMRLILNDPAAPKASHFDSMKILMRSFDNFNIERSRLNLDGSALGRARVELLKKRFQDWVFEYTSTNPAVNSFWLTVLRPESGLD